MSTSIWDVWNAKQLLLDRFIYIYIELKNEYVAL